MDAVSVRPRLTVPETDGATWMMGGSLTSAVGAEADALARLPVAVTTTRTVFPASAVTGV